MRCIYNGIPSVLKQKLCRTKIDLQCAWHCEDRHVVMFQKLPLLVGDGRVQFSIRVKMSRTFAYPARLLTARRTPYQPFLTPGNSPLCAVSSQDSSHGINQRPYHFTCDPTSRINFLLWARPYSDGRRRHIVICLYGTFPSIPLRLILRRLVRDDQRFLLMFFVRLQPCTISVQRKHKTNLRG